MIATEIKNVQTYYNEMLENKENVSCGEITEMAYKLAEAIISDPLGMVRMNKKRVGYGYWESKGFANQYYFGKDLSNVIEKALTGFTTNEEEFEFEVSDFKVELAEQIEASVY